MDSPLQFAEESLQTSWDEYCALGELHWQETEAYRHGQQYAPSKERYIRYNAMGFYRFFAARCDGEMVGYGGMYVTDSMHTQKRIAQEDTWFMRSDHRKGMNAVRLFRFMEAQLLRDGVVEISCSVKHINGAGAILRRLKYRHIADVYSKDLTHVLS